MGDDENYAKARKLMEKGANEEAVALFDELLKKEYGKDVDHCHHICATKIKLQTFCAEVINDDEKFSDDMGHVKAAAITKKVTEYLRKDPKLQDHKLYIKSTVLNVNGLASSSFSYWDPEKDKELSVRWKNSAGCSVFIVAIALPL